MRVCTGLALLFMAAALNSDDGGSRAWASTAAFAFAILTVVVFVLGAASAIFGVVVEQLLTADNVLLSVAWTHIPGVAAKSTHLFTAAGDDELLQVAQTRDPQTDHQGILLDESSSAAESDSDDMPYTSKTVSSSLSSTTTATLSLSIEDTSSHSPPESLLTANSLTSEGSDL